MTDSAGKRVTIVTIHGTGDTAAGLDGEKWFQNGSAFVARMKARLATHGVEAEIVPHLWSGLNSARGREAGANALSERLRKMRKTHDAIHLIGHSHGGNVANDAAVALGWKGDACNSKVKSLVTIGTPYFRREIAFAVWLGALLFLIVVGLVAACGALLVLIQLISDSSLSFKINAMVAFGLIFGGEMLLVRFAYRGWRRVASFRRRPRMDGAEIQAIWHPDDEAIAFLQRIDQSSLVAFPPLTFWRGSHSMALNSGVLIVTPFALGWFLTTLATGDFNFTDFLVYGPAVTTLLFATIYIIVRAIFGAAPEILMRGWFNSVVANSVKGIAFGGDGEDQIGKISPRSHYFATQERILDGEVAARMQVNSQGAASALIEKYRWSLFSVGGSGDETAIDSLATDAMTWESLIHTTYFDQPEIADMIADQIAAVARERS